MSRIPTERFERLLDDDRPSSERERLARLMSLFSGLPPPPDPHGLFPRFAELMEKFLLSASGADREVLEEDFLNLYSHIHGYEVPLTPEERTRFQASNGYLNHVGGLSPILKAGAFIRPDTVSGDFGAGTGLQGLLLQHLYPHAKTVNVEISSRLVESGRHLQDWLGIADDRVKWIVSDINAVSPVGMDFIYLYRPVRPSGAGRRFYEKFAAELDRGARHLIIFSIADCLRSFLSERFEAFYEDGHLTCFRRLK
jgi:hypothetical protein